MTLKVNHLKSKILDPQLNALNTTVQRVLLFGGLAVIGYLFMYPSNYVSPLNPYQYEEEMRKKRMDSKGGDIPKTKYLLSFNKEFQLEHEQKKEPIKRWKPYSWLF